MFLQFARTFAKWKVLKKVPQNRQAAEPVKVELSLAEMACDEDPSPCKRIEKVHSYDTSKAVAENKVKVLRRKIK